MPRKKLIQPRGSAAALFTNFKGLSEQIKAISRRVRTPAIERRENTGQCPVELSEVNGNLVVRASVPGYAPDDIRIHVESDWISINGEHQEKEKKMDGQVIFGERRDAFMRKLLLPTEVNPEESQALLKNGVLEITLPKNNSKSGDVLIETKMG